MASIEQIRHFVRTTDIDRCAEHPMARLHPRTMVIFQKVMLDCRILMYEFFDPKRKIDCAMQQRIDIAAIDYSLVREAIEEMLGEDARLVFTADVTEG